jgi:hypothetical protein
VHFYPHLCTPEKTSRSVTHPEIALGQACLTSRFFVGELSEKKVYLGGTSILLNLLSLESGCHKVYDPRGLPGVMTARPGVAGVLQLAPVSKY